MKFLLGTKQNMTQLFGEDGRAYVATVISAGPVKVTGFKTKARDGYSALQVGYGIRKAKRIGKAVLGHTKELGNIRTLREKRLDKDTEIERGTEWNVSEFTEGDMVEVVGTSKGKGFAGVVKRHGFHGGPRSHGQKHSERAPGSIGAGGYQRVFKGRRMAGMLGGDQVTTKGLRVLAVSLVRNEMVISGAIPGRRGSILEIHG